MDALLKRMDYQKVSVAELNPLRVKLIMSGRQRDLRSKLVANILENESLGWKHLQDTATAKDINKNAKLDAEVFYRGCTKKTFILYDRKDEKLPEIQSLLTNTSVYLIATTGVAKGISTRLRTSFRHRNS